MKSLAIYIAKGFLYGCKAAQCLAKWTDCDFRQEGNDATCKYFVGVCSSKDAAELAKVQHSFNMQPMTRRWTCSATGRMTTSRPFFEEVDRVYTPLSDEAKEKVMAAFVNIDYEF